MFSSSLARSGGLVKNVRYFRINSALRDAKSVTTESSPASTPNKSSRPDGVLGPQMHRCSDFDRWLLVWTKKFPNKEAVPEKITVDLLHKAQSQGRIRSANVMIVLTIIGCVWAVMSGKKEAKAGNTLSKQNVEWHKKINDEYKASLAASKTT